jgi:hypothetical protein
MKTSRNASFKPAVPLTTDLHAYFENLWHQVDRSELGEEGGGIGGTVRLECTGELVAADSLGLAVVRRTAGGEHIEFVCPRCNALHESLCVG